MKQKNRGTRREKTDKKGIITMPYLPGNTSQRLTELRSQKGLTQEQLCSELAIAGLGYYDRSTISRVESGAVTNISSELIAALVKYFDVTADFLLGLTDIPDKKNYELSELGLSYEAARKLLRREVNPDALNRFIECKSFAGLCEKIALFYHSSMTQIYAKVDNLFAGIRGLADRADNLGYTLTEEQRKALQTELSSLSDRLDPVRVKKQDMIDSFTKVMDELGNMMNEGIDPEAMIMTDEAFRRRVQTEEYGSTEPVMSQEEMAERATQGVEALLSDLGLDGKEDKAAFMQLLTSMNNKCDE